MLSLYAAGYFPMDSPEEAGELPFYAAHQRAVFDLGAEARAAVRRRVRRSLRAGPAWTLEIDRCFTEVVANCALPRAARDSMWLTPRLAELYARLHEAGVAHSIEVHAGGRLAAGLIAITLGRAAMLESMFHRVPHAGNVLVVGTLDHLAERGFVLCDIQLPTDHTVRLGAEVIPREEYERRLSHALAPGR